MARGKYSDAVKREIVDYFNKCGDVKKTQLKYHIGYGTLQRYKEQIRLKDKEGKDSNDKIKKELNKEVELVRTENARLIKAETPMALALVESKKRVIVDRILETQLIAIEKIKEQLEEVADISKITKFLEATLKITHQSGEEKEKEKPKKTVNIMEQVNQFILNNGNGKA